jgi:hypothetical protein
MEVSMPSLNLLRERLMAIPIDNPQRIPLQGNRDFQVTPVANGGYLAGVNVNNLGANPFLPFDVFVATISLLTLSENNTAIKGSAQKGVLGSDGLPLNSIEGHIARIIYGYQIGENVFRRIVPIANILAWADVCENERGYLTLIEN